jgi:hypothetical protein
MTEEEKVAEGIRIIQDYLSNRREKEQIPGTREYEIEQMCRPVREAVAAMSQEERDVLQERFQVKLAQIRAEMGYPPIREKTANYLEQLQFSPQARSTVQNQIDQIDGSFLVQHELEIQGNPNALRGTWCNYFRNLDPSDLSLFRP